MQTGAELNLPRVLYSECPTFSRNTHIFTIPLIQKGENADKAQRPNQNCSAPHQTLRNAAPESRHTFTRRASNIPASAGPSAGHRPQPVNKPHGVNDPLPFPPLQTVKPFTVTRTGEASRKETLSPDGRRRPATPAQSCENCNLPTLLDKRFKADGGKKEIKT